MFEYVLRPVNYLCCVNKKAESFAGIYMRRGVKGENVMDEELRKKLREVLEEYYGVDINEAQCHFSTQNYAFVFPDKPYMIRVSMTPKRTRKEILSELMWVDDIKAFKQTICEPSVSLRGKILEEFEIDGVTYRASIFRTARGKVRTSTECDPMYFICVGELLGAVHEASEDQMRNGIRYRRKDGRETMRELLAKAKGRVPAAVYDSMCGIEKRVNAIETSEEKFGLCHGDFHGNNFFVESNNIWLFDFDSCRYFYYMFDIASFVMDCLLKRYGGEKDARKCLYEDILPYFRIGYEIHRKVDESFYKDLELFISCRALNAMTNLLDIQKYGGNMQIEQIKQIMFDIVSAPDVLDALTQLRRMQRGI